MTTLWIVLLVIGAVVGVVVVFLAVMYFRAVRGGKKVFLDIMRSLDPILLALQDGKEPDAGLVREAAAGARTRNALFDMHLRYQRLDLFPSQFHTWEAMTESDLVFWLLHPNELGCQPDEIELMEQVPADDGGGLMQQYYFVFRYRTHPPHWAAKDGWLAGVVGPHNLRAEPAPGSQAVFSRFDAYDSRTPEEHVRITQETFGRRK